MELLGYVVESEELPGVVQAGQLRQFCRRRGDVLLDVQVERADAAGLPFLSRPVGRLVYRAVADRRVEGTAVLSTEGVFDHAYAHRPVLCALWTLGWPICSADAVSESAGRGGDGRWSGRTPFGCLRLARKLYRNPWTWPVREQIVGLRRLLGLDYDRLAACLRRLGLRDANATFAWPAEDLGDIVRYHEAVRHAAIRDVAAVAAYVRDEMGHEVVHTVTRDVRESPPPRYGPRRPLSPANAIIVRADWKHWGGMAPFSPTEQHA